MHSRLLITGASSDLGLTLLRHLARTAPGIPVLAHCHGGATRLNEIRGELTSLGSTEIVEADLSTVEGIAKLVDATLAGECPHQYVHLPALPYRYERLQKFDWDFFLRDLSVQLRSFVSVSGVLLPTMAKRCAVEPSCPNGKVVVVLSSVVLGAPTKFTAMYTAAKYALMGAMRVAAAEFAEKRVNINAVSPSLLSTRFVAGIPSKVVELAAAQNPLHRNGCPADVVPLISFLLSAEADFINGANVPVTAGMAS